MNYTPEQLTEFGKLLGDVWLTKMKPAERVAGLKPAERLAGLKAEEVEEIEDCLKQLKKQEH